jgi:hypothetical protein
MAQRRTKQTAKTAARQSRAVASRAADETQNVALEAKSQARDLATTARSQASNVAEEVTAQGRTLIEETRAGLQEQAEGQADKLIEALRSYGEQARAVASGRVDDGGVFADLVREAADRIDDAVDRIESRGLDGLAEDLESFARRRPGAFLLGAAVSGFVVGRVLRGAAAQDGGR